MPGTEDGDFPFWSPDGRALGFFAGGRLKTIDIAGGESKTLCDAGAGRGGTWSRDNVILFARSRQESLYRIDAEGGAARPATTIDKERRETGHLWPQFLPDGRHFFYLADADANPDHAIRVGVLDRTESRVVLKDVQSRPIYAAAGYLLFALDDKLIAQHFDLRRLEVVNDGFPIVEQGPITVLPDDDHFVPASLSENDVLVYRQAPSPVSELVWRDRTGAKVGTVGNPARYEDPVISPDGTRVVVGRPDDQGRNFDLWILDAEKGSQLRFTSGAAPDFAPVLSPDGEQVAFESIRQEGIGEIYRKSLSGGAAEQMLAAPGAGKIVTDWTPDGQALIFSASNSKGDYDIWALRLSDGSEATPIVQTPHNDTGGKVSPDGHWIAYVSDESGTPEIFAQPFPGPGGRRQLSVRGGTEPVWRRDGKELFYLAVDGYVMAVDIRQTSTRLGEGTPKRLFGARPMRGRYDSLSAFNQTSYAVAPDGQRFLFNTPLEETPAFPLIVVLNWDASLSRHETR